MNRSCVVAVADILCAVEECFAKRAFVSERPDDNTGSVLVTLHQSRMSVGDAGLPGVKNSFSAYSDQSCIS